MLFNELCFFSIVFVSSLSASPAWVVRCLIGEPSDKGRLPVLRPTSNLRVEKMLTLTVQISYDFILGKINDICAWIGMCDKKWCIVGYINIQFFYVFFKVLFRH